jgi:cyclic beta-1,2-glucan synthetase
VPLETCQLLGSVARVVLVAQRGRLAEQLDRIPHATTQAPAVSGRESQGQETPVTPVSSGVEFFNGLGGFADDGREYVIILGPGQSTPAPWVNVIANPDFGLAGAEGGYTGPSAPRTSLRLVERSGH